MRYVNGVDSVTAMQWKGDVSKHELMSFTNEDFLGMMKSDKGTSVFVDGVDGVSIIVVEGNYVIKESEGVFSTCTEEEFKVKYNEYNTIII